MGRDRAVSASSITSTSTASTLHIKLQTDGARSRVARTQPSGTPPGASQPINDLVVQSGKMAQAARTSAVAQSKRPSNQPALSPGRRPTANIERVWGTVAYPPEPTLAQAASGRRLSVFSATGDATDGQGLEMLPGAYRRSGEYEAAFGSQPTLDRHDLEAAMGATFAQRGTTYAAAHSLALASQVLTLITAGALGASKAQMNAASTVIGGLVAALGKEAVGEIMKTRRGLGASIQVPRDTRQQARVMAGFYDMVTSMASAFTGAAVSQKVVPMLTDKFLDRGLPQPLAEAAAMGVSFIAQRSISMTSDTVSDLATTLSKFFYPDAYADDVVNPKIDYDTMLAGMLARMLINWGLTLPLGVPVALGKWGDWNANSRVSIANGFAWAGLNGWIVVKAALAKAELASKISTFRSS